MDVNPTKLKVDTCIYSETDNSGTGNYSCELLTATLKESHPQPVSGVNIARKRTNYPSPCISHLSEINAKPMDREIPSIRQFDATKRAKLLIPALDGDDEVCIWVENPVVIDLTSDDESSCKNDSRHEKIAHLETTLSDMKNEVFVISDVDEDDPKCGPSKNPVDTVVHASSSEGKSCSALPESDKILITPSINATATGGTRTEPAILVIRRRQSLDQAPQMPEPLRSTRSLSVDSPSLQYVSPQQHAVFPTWQSEPHDTGSRHTDRHSKKRKLSPDRLNNATSGTTKAKLFNPMTEEENDAGPHCNEAYEVVRQSHIRSSQSGKKRKAMDESADSNSEMKPTSRKIQAESCGVENDNGTNQMNKHPQCSENHQSSRSRVDDKFHSYESSQRSRIRIRWLDRGTMYNRRTSERYRARYSDVDKRLITETVSSRNELMNDRDTQMNKQFESSNNRWRSRKSEKIGKWEAISLKKESCRLILSNAFDFLSDAYDKYRVQARVTRRRRGNDLWICGTKADRRRFKDDFVKFEKLQTGNESVELPNCL